MHTDSSASRTCRLSRSASLNTATVEIWSSRQARITRSAISPRFAIRTLRNILPLDLSRAPRLAGRRRRGPHRAAGGRRRPVRQHAGDRLGLLAAGRVDCLPQAVRSGGDALELERELVRVGAVPERLLFGDQSLAQQLHHTLVEG